MKSRRLARSLTSGATLLALSGLAGAQLDNQWVSFTKTPNKLAVAPLSISDITTQVIFRTGDLDRDGWDDVVAVRKSQGAQLGPRQNVLLMNIEGVLTDKTAEFATASDVSGDMGFNTPTNDMDVAIGDVDGDGWLDVVTCVALSDGQPKHISHPRVYINLGDDMSGEWLGLNHEDARFPQLTVMGSGLAVAPRFYGIALGDVTGDGALDLYFVDADTSETGISEPAALDLNDRLLVNDGNGYFTDESALRLTTAQLKSTFDPDTTIVDLNNDGARDIVKVNLVSPSQVRAVYNNPADVGDFTGSVAQDVGTFSPLGVCAGDLNHDAFVDIVTADAVADRFWLGTGFDGLNQMIWSPSRSFTFLNGADDGFARDVHIQDLDNDGWNDVLISAMEGDLIGCNRRGHIYHNTGSVPGDQNLVITEEVELASGNQGAGWKGVVGMSAADLKGAYDFAMGDFDRDGDVDILLANCLNGAVYYQNNTDAPPQLCQPDLGNAGPGSMSFSVCGDDLTYAGSSATLSLTGAAPSIALNLVVGLTANPIPLKGGTLVPNPVLTVLTGLSAMPTGDLTLPVAGGVSIPTHIILQFVAKNGSVFEFSNALDVEIGF